MKKTKLLSLILALLMLVSSTFILASCGKDEGEPSDGTEDITPSDTTPSDTTSESDKADGDGNESDGESGDGDSDADTSKPVTGIGDNELDITVDVSEW